MDPSAHVTAESSSRTVPFRLFRFLFEGKEAENTRLPCRWPFGISDCSDHGGNHFFAFPTPFFSPLSFLLYSSLFSCFMGILEFIMRMRPTSRKAGLLLLGLDSAGKSCILRQLSDEDVTHVTPTHGFLIKTLVAGGVKLNVWDMGGARGVRHYWRQYFGETDVLIYVVDAANPRRMQEAKEELDHLLEEEKIAGVPMLIFANKQDLIGALSPQEVAVLLDLTDLRDRQWHIQGCSAKTGEGLGEGISWVVMQMKN